MRQWQICTSPHAVRSLQYLLRNKQLRSVASLIRSLYLYLHRITQAVILELTDPCSVKPMIHDQSDVPPVLPDDAEYCSGQEFGFLKNSSQIELVPGARRMLENFLTGVSSWTKQV